MKKDNKPFKIFFKNNLFCSVSINKKSGEFYLFPNFHKYNKNETRFDLEEYNLLTPVEKKDIDHFSWHKDGKLHIKYNDNSKTIIDIVEKEFSEINDEDLLPLCNLSIRRDSEYSIICLLAGKKILKNLTLLPDPYSFFIRKNTVNEHIVTISNNELMFGYIFIFIQGFIPRNDTKSFLSLTCPLQEDQIKELVPKKQPYCAIKYELKPSVPSPSP